MANRICSFESCRRPVKGFKLDCEHGGLLFTLPRELRNQIYEFALVAMVPIDVLNFAELAYHHLPQQKLGLSPAILATNRVIHDEAITILYGLNTFRANVNMRLHQALRRVEVEKALRTLRLPPGVDIPEPEIFCTTDRPHYTHPSISLIRRFEVRLKQVVPDLPHWHDGGINVDHAMQDLCTAFVEPGHLKLFILSSDGCETMDRWLPAAGEQQGLAKNMEIMMWQYHEWHFERAVLAANRQSGVLWVNSDRNRDRYSLETQSVFHPGMRSLLRVPTTGLPWSRELPKYLERTGELANRVIIAPRSSAV